MKAVSVIAASALSALGRGGAAYAMGGTSTRARRGLAVDSALSASGLAHAFVGRVLIDERGPGGDPATALLGAACSDLAVALDAARPSWREQRVGVVLGTSSGGMRGIETALAARYGGGRLSSEVARGASYAAPLAVVSDSLGIAVQPLQLLAACASSTLAIGLACRWLEAGLYDLVIAGGYDALSALVARGFQALGALTASEPRPFGSARDGMALGEGAALVALALTESLPALERNGVIGTVLGFGASSDAVHVTAPDRDGKGLASAAELSLWDARLRPDAVDFVSAHGTATLFNDAAEAQALARVLAPRLLPVPVHAFKAAIGHTLGAAGALEALAAWDALRRGVVPATAGAAAVETPEVIEVLERNRASAPSRVLKLSAAFGGANAALVLGPAQPGTAGAARLTCGVALAATGPFAAHAEPGRFAELPPAVRRVVARADALSELVLAAVARLIEASGVSLPRRCAVVVGTACATLEQDELFDLRRRQGLPPEPKHFPATSPNLSAGLCSIAFGLTGPTLAVGGGAGAARHAALVGYDLVAFGDADAALVVAAEEVGPVVFDLSGAAGLPPPPRGASAILLGPCEAGVALSRDRLAGVSFPADGDFGRWLLAVQAETSTAGCAL